MTNLSIINIYGGNVKKVKNLVRDFLRLTLGKRLYIKVRFILTHGYWPNLRHPRTWNEKIQYRKLNDSPFKFSRYVDKYTVRSEISREIGEEYLIPLIGVYEKIEPSHFNDLPNSFVIKTSNGGGGENVLIIEDKSNIDIVSICKRFNRYLNIKIGEKIDEAFYDIEKPVIIVEHLLRHNDGRFPSDYKLHIFNGKRQEIIIQIDEDRFGNHKRSLFDIDGKKLNFNIQPKYDEVSENYIFPENFNDLVYKASLIASKFKYSRVDMYNVDGNVFFGEITFCHGSGWEPTSTKDVDFMLGRYWEEYN